MRILVVGASGLLGSNVADVALNRTDEVVIAYHTLDPGFDCPSHQLDITSASAVGSLVSAVDPDAVINCAAMTDVDGCETDPERAHAVNATGARNLARAAERADARLVHTSTDYVFDGDRSEPYPEDAEPNPRQEYGKSKLAGESSVRRTHPDPMIVRLSFVYGRSLPAGTLSGFPALVCNQAANEADIPLFIDQHVSPSYASSTATTILDLLEHGQSGTFNVAGTSCISPHEFGKAILDESGIANVSVSESSMKDVDRTADRPPYTCLDVQRVEETLGRPQPTVREDLSDLF